MDCQTLIQQYEQTKYFSISMKMLIPLEEFLIRKPKLVLKENAYHSVSQPDLCIF